MEKLDPGPLEVQRGARRDDGSVKKAKSRHENVSPPPVPLTLIASERGVLVLTHLCISLPRVKSSPRLGLATVPTENLMHLFFPFERQLFLVALD